MSSSRAEPRSISTQLVLLFTLSAALLLSCSLGILYWVVVRHAFEEDNIVLADKVDALENALQQGGLDALSPEIHETHGSEYAFLVRVLDSSGATIKQTPGMETLLPANVFPPSASREIAAPIEYQKAGHVFALTTRGPVANGQPFTLQVGQNRSSDRRFEKELRTLLALVLGLGVIASALIAVTVARRGLRPLAEMRRSLERVQPGHLSERIEPARWPRELQPLAVSFDAMLGRLEDSFTRLSQFSADLAHELRTPIGNMIGEAQVALTRERNADEYRSVIESTAAECERLSGIIDNLLFLARADSAEPGAVATSNPIQIWKNRMVPKNFCRVARPCQTSCAATNQYNQRICFNGSPPRRKRTQAMLSRALPASSTRRVCSVSNLLTQEWVRSR